MAQNMVNSTNATKYTELGTDGCNMAENNNVDITQKITEMKINAILL